MIIDVIAVVLVVLLVIRGWIRGFVSEAIDVGTLILGVVLAFRLAPHAGRVLTGLIGVSPDLARLIGGTVLFVGVVIGASLVGSLINKSIKHLPGLSTLNRIGGAALGAVYATVLVVIAITLIAAAPLPEAVGKQVDESRVADVVTRPDGIAQRAMGVMAGDRALQSMIWIRSLVDGWVIDSRVTDITLPGDASTVHVSAESARALFDDVNEARNAEGLPALVWSDDMSAVAVDRAVGVYQTGSLEASTPVTDRLDAAGVSFEDADEYLVLAPTVDGLGEAAGVGAGFSKAGIGVVDGPYGLVGVVVLAN